MACLLIAAAISVTTLTFGLNTALTLAPAIVLVGLLLVEAQFGQVRLAAMRRRVERLRRKRRRLFTVARRLEATGTVFVSRSALRFLVSCAVRPPPVLS